MNQQIFTLTPPSGSLPSTGLGFQARAVIVDNYTSSYVNITEAGVTLPPWIYGAVVALPPGILQAKASLTATTPAPTGPIVPVQQATLVWTDVAIPANSGHLLTQPSYQLPTVVGTFRSPINTVTTKTYDVPSGTVAVGVRVALDNPPGTGSIAPKITLTGHQSQAEYKIVYFPQFSIYTSLWNSFTDTSLDAIIDNTGNAIETVLYEFIAYPFVPGNPGPVVENGTPPFAGTNTPPSIGTLVTSNGSDPAPWQAAKSVVTFNSSIASGATSVIIPATAGVTVYLHSFTIGDDGANTLSRYQFQDTSANDLDVFIGTNIRSTKVTGTFSGARLTTGRGVQILNAGANASFISGNLCYNTA